MYLGLRKVLRNAFNRERPSDIGEHKREEILDRAFYDVSRVFESEIDRLREAGESFKTLTQAEEDILSLCAGMRSTAIKAKHDQQDRQELVKEAARCLKSSIGSQDRYGDILSAIAYLTMELEAIARIEAQSDSPKRKIDKPKSKMSVYDFDPSEYYNAYRRSILGMQTNATTPTRPPNVGDIVRTGPGMQIWQHLVRDEVPVFSPAPSTASARERVSSHQTPPVERVQAQREQAERTNRERVEAMRTAMRAAMRRRPGDVA